MLLTTKEVAAILKVSQTTIYEMAQAGQLPFVKVGARGGRYRFKQADVEEYIERSTKRPAPPSPERKRPTRAIQNFQGFDLLRAAGWKG